MSPAEPSEFRRPDLTVLWSQLAQPWRDLQGVAPFAWLAPELPVCLLHADGSTSLWVGDRRRPAPARDAATAHFVAVELPADEVLELALSLPPMPPADRRDAIALEVRAVSPFEPEDLVWGWRDAAGANKADTVTAVLASRRAVQARLAAAGQAGRHGPPEAWALDGLGRPVVLQGFGEAERLRRGAQGRGWGWGLLASAAALAAAVAVTPTIQLELRARQVEQAYREAERQLAPVLAQREALVTAQTQQGVLRGLMAERVEPLAVLDLLTRAVPDDSFLQRLQVQGSKVTMTGQTPNTAALMNALSGQPLIRDVRSPTASTRSMTAGRENFTIELSLQPDALRPPASAAPAASAASAAAVTPSASGAKP